MVAMVAVFTHREIKGDTLPNRGSLLPKSQYSCGAVELLTIDIDR